MSIVKIPFSFITRFFSSKNSPTGNHTEVTAQQIENGIQAFYQQAIENYLRDSSVPLLAQQINPLIKSYLRKKPNWLTRLDTKTIDGLKQIVPYAPIEQNVNKLRAKYEETILAKRQYFYDKIESNPLTEEQRLAVIRNNDRNLVLAAAGTGKTSVIVAKVLDLIDSGKACPTDILVLAYNTAAAKELRERLSQRARLAGLKMKVTPSIMTFHALGRMVLQQATIPTYLSVFVNDSLKREIWLSNWLSHRLKTDAKALRNFIDISVQPTRPFNFTNESEYKEYIRDNELRTLQDEKVHNHEELLVANWLFLHSINYCYKPRFIAKNSSKISINNKANFHLLNTPKQSTYLIKTQHFKGNETKLEKQLRGIIKKTGLEAIPKPQEAIFQILNKNGFILEGVKLYLKCLQAIRTEQLNAEGILKRLQAAKIHHAKKQADFLWEIVNAYQAELLRQEAIDFDDMILRAIEALQKQNVTPAWKHILIDEFQDISGARMELIQALIRFGPHPCFTAVGDDWQAIYRFAGGKLELTTQFDRLVGSNTKTLLQKTFRYNNNIAEVAGRFVMQNPEQFKKHIQTHHSVSEPQIYLLDSRTAENKNEIEHRALQAVSTIRKHDPSGSIAILARYRYLLTNAQNHITTQHKNNINYWTFHGAKGLEADYCILLGFFKGKVGFPNQSKDEALLEALLPSLDSYPYSEERRLFYVALTRAKKKSYLIADSVERSLFVDELLAEKYNIHLSGGFLRKSA